MEFVIKKTFDDCIEQEILIKVHHYRPDRPAPYAPTPSHFGYDDSGDPLECEYDAFIIEDNKEIPLDNDLYDYIDDEVCDRAIKEYREEKLSMLYDFIGDRYF